jgi:hypothetical protein
MTARKLYLAGLGICMALGIIEVSRIPASTQAKSDQSKTPEIESISAEELKAKVIKKEPVTIIDSARATLTSAVKTKSRVPSS